MDLPDTVQAEGWFHLLKSERPGDMGTIEERLVWVRFRVFTCTVQVDEPVLSLLARPLFLG